MLEMWATMTIYISPGGHFSHLCCPTTVDNIREERCASHDQMLHWPFFISKCTSFRQLCPIAYRVPQRRSQCRVTTYGHLVPGSEHMRFTSSRDTTLHARRWPPSSSLYSSHISDQSARFLNGKVGLDSPQSRLELYRVLSE